jgi:hypothetical protein
LAENDGEVSGEEDFAEVDVEHQVKFEYRALFLFFSFPLFFCIFFLLSTIKNILGFQWNLCKYEIIVDFRRHFWGTPVQSAGAASLRLETILQVLL